MTSATVPIRTRCAIYTRKSTDEGLDQAFNSLHAQRDACEAYVLSQTGEGWSALPKLYDDGGFSGGNMERPALAELLKDIANGKIDTVVVYKIDRLTRSLADFARIVDVFDTSNVSFVSVTQAFNTTTSMGRLTLNVLLSFAQFEREVTGERIRDKIALSKARGMWMGGRLPLGYDAPIDPATRALVPNQTEAALVRRIFGRYLELGSVHALEHWLRDENIRSKVQVTKTGKVCGGLMFSRGALFHLLKNRTYLGEILHKDKGYSGAHPPIVDVATFDAAQALLEGNAQAHKDRPTRAGAAMLKGLIFDADGHPMSPSFTYRGAKRIHRYYVSAPLQLGRPLDDSDGVIRRLPGETTEAFILERLSRLPIAPRNDGEVATLIQRVDIWSQSIEITLSRTPFKELGPMTVLLARAADGLNPGDSVRAHPNGSDLILSCPVRLKLRGGRHWIETPDGRPALSDRRADAALIAGLRQAHLSARTHKLIGPDVGDGIAPTNPYHRKRVRLAFLAPDIQAAILEGRHPAGMILDRLLAANIPLAWSDQRKELGFPAG